MNSFIVSDTHFGHENTWAKFKNSDGSPLRPFSSTEEMNEVMVERWNKKVNKNDVVYHLGDVVISKKFLPIMDRLNGSKRLIMGNHDIFGHEEYLKYFKKVYGVRVFVDQFIFSHIPLHPDSISSRFVVNIHGHLHGNEVKWVKLDGENTKEEFDPRYLCACVEHTNYEPISFEEAKQKINKRWEISGYEKPNNGWGNGSGPS